MIAEQGGLLCLQVIPGPGVQQPETAKLALNVGPFPFPLVCQVGLTVWPWNHPMLQPGLFLHGLWWETGGALGCSLMAL